MINLRSDTFTMPSTDMRKVIQNAEVGDDYYAEDESANRLEDYCKELFGVEDAVFATSGMLSNRLAVMSQTRPGDELVTDHSYHINMFESGAIASLAGIVINTVQCKQGVITTSDLKKAIDSKPREEFYTQVKLVSIENTINSHQGKIYPLEEIKHISEFCRKANIRLHLDGARLFNAHVATKIPLKIYAQYADTINVCFSKGLGAPFGSILMGSKETIKEARRLRVWLGSGFHQIGMNAKACYFALENQLDRLAEDHRLTKLLAQKIAASTPIQIDLNSIETNMIYFDVGQFNITAADFVERCKKNGVFLCEWLPTTVRIVLHRDIQEKDVLFAAEIIEKVSNAL